MNKFCFLHPFSLAMACALPALGQEFRIETQVYTGRHSKLVSENLTLFTEKAVYDFMFQPEGGPDPVEIVIYDLEKRRFVMIDEVRQLKLEMDESELARLVASLKSSASWRENFPFLLEPKFEISFDSATGRLALTSKNIAYSVKTEAPAVPSAFSVYGQFLDAYAQLNATDPQKLPPFARLELNRELKSRRLMPTEVEMTLELPNRGIGSSSMSAVSKHSIIWQMSRTDHDRIEKANQHWTRYRAATLAEYRNLSQGTALR